MISLKAPAKINWSLSVLGRRDDGYHDVATLMQCVGLWDTLTFESSGRLEVVTDAPIPLESNLVYKAALALRGFVGTREGARISLDKAIPMGAGLGGGSSDAAATLRGLNRLWGIHLGNDSLIEMGRALGSDVPFFFRCPLAVAAGRGDLVRSAGPATRQVLLLVKPSFSVSTAWAYGELAASRSRGAGEDGGTPSPDRQGCEGSGSLTRAEAGGDNIRLICKALGEGDLRQLESLARNDLEEVVVRRHPAVSLIKQKLKEAGASLALMSGSGSAVFGLFANREEAQRAAGLFPLHWTSVTETLTGDL